MSMSPVDDLTKSRRLALLRVLRENDGAANESILKVALHQLGFRGRMQDVSALAADYAYLVAQGLAVEEWYQERVRILSITDKGKSFLVRTVAPIPGIEYPD